MHPGYEGPEHVPRVQRRGRAVRSEGIPAFAPSSSSRRLVLIIFPVLCGTEGWKEGHEGRPRFNAMSPSI